MIYSDDLQPVGEAESKDFPVRQPLDVCCHTHHKSPGQPCGFHGRVQEPCAMRLSHFKSQVKAEHRTCPVCIGHLRSSISSQNP